MLTITHEPTDMHSQDSEIKSNENSENCDEEDGKNVIIRQVVMILLVE